mmetsp:Transcript_9914/g.26185  ORF Transcript_9914/g.26185 Transcript_9914/m.26185 type:complete len:214 (-) Transcript_9914:192-833(-)
MVIHMLWLPFVPLRRPPLWRYRRRPRGHHRMGRRREDWNDGVCGICTTNWNAKVCALALFVILEAQHVFLAVEMRLVRVGITQQAILRSVADLYPIRQLALCFARFEGLCVHGHILVALVVVGTDVLLEAALVDIAHAVGTMPHPPFHRCPVDGLAYEPLVHGALDTADQRLSPPIGDLHWLNQRPRRWGHRCATNSRWTIGGHCSTGKRPTR